VTQSRLRKETIVRLKATDGINAVVLAAIEQRRAEEEDEDEAIILLLLSHD